ncbi:hypothetical protein M2132_001785 [Dysgonomonas sp. PH5-45]|uniref:hypothetical protein n=1 Tax=unclassified Dysgonomonas TaxID=2630389 RepID=UPI002473D8AE|nr:MULTISPECIES: hypothetical protein [unclassified Dysgonomonas]MDH6355442.1 hypothetical protein [Dysgonomonas sp. PH5-45]MDH6388339.1 hypothetical protein [Dysgonomonas sp. PH5-37]
MTLEEVQKQYPDAMKASLTMTTEAMQTHNFYKTDELRKYLQTIFPGNSILYCNCSGRKITAITSKEAYEEEKRQLSMVPGTKVIMTGSEGDFPEYKDKVWEVYAGPKWMCGSLVVWLEGFSGAYSCEHLKIVIE